MTYDARQGMDTDDTSVGGDADPTAERVQRAVAGDERAFGELYDAWFDRVHDLAYGVVRDRSVAAEVAQDTFLRAWQQLGTVRDPSVFGGWLLRIARNTALNRLRTERRTTAVDDQGMAVIERGGPSPVSAPAGFRVEDRLHSADDPAAAAADDEIVTLVQDAADALDGRDAEVLHLGLRYGLTPAEIGESIGLSRNAANQAVHRARRRLRTAVEARVLWRRGEPDCAELAAGLAAAGVVRFGAEAVAIADAHAIGCERCTDHRRLRLDPSVLFGAAPLLGAPAMLKTQIAHALAQQGVPMVGSGSAGGTTGGSAEPAGGPGSDAGSGDAGSGDAGSGDAGSAGSPAAPVAPVQTRPRGRRRLVLALVAVVALVAAGIGIAAVGGSPGETEARSGAAPPWPDDLVANPPTTGLPTGSTTGSPTGSPTTLPAPGAPTTPPETVPATRGTTPSTTVAPPAPPPPPPVPTGSLAITPSVKARPWTILASSAPVLTWSTANAGSVTVEGPGVGSTAATGSVLLCPNGQSSSQCFPTLGTYRYRLTVRDGSGAVAVTEEKILVVVA